MRVSTKPQVGSLHRGRNGLNALRPARFKSCAMSGALITRSTCWRSVLGLDLSQTVPAPTRRYLRVSGPVAKEVRRLGEGDFRDEVLNGGVEPAEHTWRFRG